MLHGWNDPSCKGFTQNSEVELNSLVVLETKDRKLFKEFCDRIIEKSVDDIMRKKYSNLDPETEDRIRATLSENHKKFMSENLQEALKREFLERECFLNSLQTSEIENEIYIVANRELDFEPFLSKEGASINLPLQESIVLGPRSHRVINLKFQILFPWKLYGLLKPVLELPQISVFPHRGIIENRIEDGFHLIIKNNTDEKVFLKEGTSIAQLCVKRKIRDMNEKEKIPVSKMEDVRDLKILKRPPSFLHAHEGTFYPEFFRIQFLT
jgi:dUTPase